MKIKSSKKLEHTLFLGSMFICLLTSQATMVVDAIVGGSLLGANALPVVDLVLPLYDIFYSLVQLLGMGACTIASISLGQGNIEAVRRYFTGAIFSSLAVMILLCIAIYVFEGPLLNLLCGESNLRDWTSSYLSVMVPYFIFASLQIILVAFTAMAGRPILVMCCTLVQFIVNVACNLLLIKTIGLGIEALAYSSLFSTIIGILILLPFYFSKKCPFRIIRCPIGHLIDDIKINVKYGFGYFVAGLSYMIMLFAMNTFVLRALGEQMLYYWSIVIMIYLTADYASTAASETTVSLGGRYLGARDIEAAKMVYKRSMYFILIWIGTILISIFALPEYTLPLFGANYETTHSLILPFLALAIPFIAGTCVVNLYLIRLVQIGCIGLYTILSTSLYIAVPALFIIFYLLLPGYEQYAFVALLPVQIFIALSAKVFSKKSYNSYSIESEQ